MTDFNPNPETEAELVIAAIGDLNRLAAVAIIGRHVADLATACAVKLGLYAEVEQNRDLAEARILIEALAGLIDGAAPHSGTHATTLRETLKQLQQAFRHYSIVQDEPGSGPGEKYTGYVAP